MRDADAWEQRALAILPRMVADYFGGGARDEATLRANRAAWNELLLLHRVLTDVSAVDPSADFAGIRLAAPILVAPMAFQGLAHRDAEAATARGAAAAGLAMVLSTLSNTPIEAVAAHGPWAFQLYVYKDRGATDAIVERVREAGARALVLTADAPFLGTRYRDVENGFHLPDDLQLPNAAPSGRTVAARAGDSGLARYVSEQLDPTLSWADAERFVAHAGLPVWLKGVVRASDAARAAEIGAAGVIVSNHGGRQLDGGVPTALVLPEVVDAVAGRIPVWVDGGIRRGIDVARALALGARGVLVGRPVLWGLAVDGAEGVRAVLALLQGELREVMQLVGAPAWTDLTRDLIRRK